MSDENQFPQSERVSPTEPTVANSPRPVWPPVQQDFRRRQTFSPGLTIALIVLALLLVLGGLGFIIYATTVQYGSALHAEATTVAQQTVMAQGTAQAHIQATANAFATVNGNIYARATAQAGVSATQTATVDKATATTTALGDTFIQATKGTPTLDNSLSDNTGGNRQWDQSSGTKGFGCTFTNGAYHAIDAKQSTFQPCLAASTNFSNFIYQVQVTIDNGRQGGILFRSNGSKGTFYFFRIGVDGSYALDLYTSSSVATTLTHGFSAAITTGFNRSNQVAVVASGSTLSLYVDQEYVTSVTDTSLSAGQIGVAALNSRNPADVEFSHAQVWKLG